MKPKMIGVLFLMGGLLLFGWGAWVFMDAKNSTSWPTVDGRVLVSDVNTVTSRNSIKYTPKVEYEYELSSVLYRSKNIIFGAYEFSSRSSAQHIVNSYPVGKTVTVYYKSNNYKTAVLKPGMDKSSFLGMAMGAFFLAAGGYMCFSKEEEVGEVM